MKLTPFGARALFTGIVTDSGRFRYNTVSSDTFMIASKLLKYNFDFNEIYTKLYVDELELVKLRAQMVLQFKISDKGVAYLINDKTAVERYNTDIFTISRGMVNTMADLKGVDTWVNFTETEEGVLVEIRSSKYNINPIAVKYGGGGHAKASGACVKDKATAMALLEDLNALGKNEKEENDNE